MPTKLSSITVGTITEVGTRISCAAKRIAIRPMNIIRMLIRNSPIKIAYIRSGSSLNSFAR